MPLLKGKPCFGMPQVFVRHGKRTRMTTTRYGTRIETETHRCGRCKIRDSCSNLTRERLRSDRNISAALLEWNRFCARIHNGNPTFSREAGRCWQKFLKALADHGPFANSNDALLAEEEALDREKKLEKWRRDKLRQRANERASRRAAGLPPPDAFVAEAMFQRDLRVDELLALAGRSDMPARIQKITPQDANVTANITADAWLGRLLIAASGGSPTPGGVARWMIKEGRAQGKSYPVLKARMKRDLARVDMLEAHGPPCSAWRHFDPDSDLKVPLSDLMAMADDGSIDSN
ncbi:hypothetical protein ABS767_06020 [Sphingomonas sp. ST-64]|uniref:Uncharacterized protein n=1 Tax=Sphingomonas plantiphila TaxID=3163295 RepID=A0ABW8YMN7_9SPHN